MVHFTLDSKHVPRKFHMAGKFCKLNYTSKDLFSEKYTPHKLNILCNQYPD